MKRKSVIITAIVLTLTAFTGAGLYVNRSQADTEPPIVQEVRNHGETLDNHETRLTNAENNIGDLQDATSTPPSSQNTTPPTVSTPRASQPLSAGIASSTEPVPTPEPEPTPIVVKTSAYVLGGQWNNHCRLTYTDGSVEHKPATLTGEPGHMDDNCPSFLGQPKS